MAGTPPRQVPPWEGTPGADLGFGQGGPQLLRLKVADVAEWSYVTEVSYLQLGWALEAFRFLMLKYIRFQIFV